MKIIETEEPDLLLIQEPYAYQNKPAGMEKKNRVFTAGTGKHRAAIIVINSKTDAILIVQLSDEDTAVLEIVHRKQKFSAASMYFDHEEQIENKFHKMDEIMSFINGGRILIAADCNARSKTWYDVLTNSRGRKLEEYIASKQLHIINEISERSTFHNSRGSSNIDLTITNDKLISDVIGWEISTKESLSDHNYLKYIIGVGGTNSQKNDNKGQSIRYVIKENKLHIFDRKLVQEMQKMANNKIKGGGAEELDKYLSTKITTEEDLEQNIDLFAETVQSACRRTFQNTTTWEKTSKKKSVPWRTDNLTLMWKKVNACRRLFQITRNNEVLRENRTKKYLEVKRTYQVGIKKEKLNSWKEFCNVAASINPWSQVYKLAAGKTRANTAPWGMKQSAEHHIYRRNPTPHTIWSPSLEK